MKFSESEQELMRVLPPDGRDFFEANKHVREACAAACGAGIAVDVVADATMSALVELLVDTYADEQTVVDKVRALLKEYEDSVGEGTFGVVLEPGFKLKG